MRVLRFAIVAAFLALAFLTTSFATPVPKIDRDELKKLIGQWELIRSALHSELDDRGATPVEIDAEKIVIKPKGGQATYEILRLTESEIDLRKTFDPFKGNSLKGIWKIEKDHLWVCFNHYGKETTEEPELQRPTEFTSPKGSQRRVYVMKRPGEPELPKKQKKK